MTELMVIFVIGLVVLGPKRLPEMARSLGKTLAEFRRASNDMRREFMAVSDEVKIDPHEFEPTTTPEPEKPAELEKPTEAAKPAVPGTAAASAEPAGSASSGESAAEVDAKAEAKPDTNAPEPRSDG